MLDAEARDQVATLESLLEDVEAIDDPLARERALAAVQGLVELYGSGLERIVALLSERDDADELAEGLSADELVSHLFLLHDLHPVPVEVRVRQALDEVRPYLASHGGNVQLVAVEEGVVRLSMEGSCSGCPSSSLTLKLAVEDAIRKAAPDVEAIEADGAPPPPLQIELPRATTPEWVTVDDVGSLASGATVVREVDGEDVMFIRLTQSIYAYRPACAACGASLANAELADAHVICPDCATRYDVRRAGRSTGGDELQLRPLPLLRDEDRVRVALEVPA